MDTKAINQYINTKLHGTNGSVFFEKNGASMMYRITLRCDFQGKTYQIERNITGANNILPNDVLKYTIEIMVHDMNDKLAKEFQVGK